MGIKNRAYNKRNDGVKIEKDEDEVIKNVLLDSLKMVVIEDERQRIFHKAFVL